MIQNSSFLHLFNARIQFIIGLNYLRWNGSQNLLSLKELNDFYNWVSKYCNSSNQFEISFMTYGNEKPNASVGTKMLWKTWWHDDADSRLVSLNVSVQAFFNQ